MKKLLLLITLFIGVTVSAQIVDIPDANFKSHLLNYSPTIDTNGDGEIQYTEAEVITQLWALGLGISDLTGIEAFVNIELLNASGNSLTTLDLTNNLALERLELSGNDLTSIDVTNSLALEKLFLKGNDLTSIDVANNLALEWLILTENNLTSIDVANNLALRTLSKTDLTSIDVTNNLALRLLSLDGNDLTSIDVTNNLALLWLILTENNLTSIDVSQNINLENLKVSYISNIDLSNNTNLRDLNVRNSGLSSLDLSNNNNLCRLSLSNNFELNSVNIQNGNNAALIYGNFCYDEEAPPSGIYVDNNNPELHFICVDDFLFAIENFTNVPPLTSFIEDCTTASGDINRIQGVIRYDDENDGCDGGDLLLEDILVNTTDGTNNFGSISNELGFYNLNVVENTYSTIILGIPPYFTLTPNEEVDTFVGFNQTEIADFCITSNSTANDLTVSLVPTNEARPGFDASYQLVYENVGTTQLNGTIVLEFDETRVSFNEATPTPTSQTSNTITWDFGTINPFETGGISIEFILATPPTNENDDILNYTTTINPIAGDETPDDNVFQLNQTIVNSYDPNDKTVLQGHQVLIENADDYLHYVIRFQNLGTASAINVRVQDELDELLDWTSFKVLESSHEMEVRIINKQIDFIFNDINLPSETTDPEGSNGFVIFKIKPINGINLGDTIENTAHIFFDFNAAIITNTVFTTFVDELSIEDFNEIEVVLYPNPLSEILTISISENVIFKKAIVYSLLGEKLLESSEKKVSFSNLASGIYFITIETDQGSVVKRIIKE
ncbi:MAG: T9SS type A sorting domain-containing protein [Flavobacteriaceae bacterium]|nr:T9SS type A sorting domain-containing protein [Flavobacteriaceae bacterium]